MKIVGTLSKFKAERFNFSKGVFSSYEEGIASFITFSEKIEKDVLDMYPFKFDIVPDVFKVAAKFFEIKDIIFSKDKIEFMYTCSSPKELYNDANFKKVMGLIYKKDNFYCIKLDIQKTELNEKILSILNSVKNLDFENSKEFKIDIYKEINKSELPITIEDDKFFMRLSKSTFQNVTKGDVATIKCIPYKDDRSLIFLTVTTVNKPDYQIINMFNVLYLLEGDD